MEEVETKGCDGCRLIERTRRQLDICWDRVHDLKSKHANLHEQKDWKEKADVIEQITRVLGLMRFLYDYIDPCIPCGVQCYSDVEFAEVISLIGYFRQCHKELEQETGEKLAPISMLCAVNLSD